MSGRVRLTIRTRLTLIYGATWLGAATLLLIGLFLAVVTVPDYAFQAEPAATAESGVPASAPQTPSETAAPTAAPPSSGTPPTDAVGPSVDSVADLRLYLLRIGAIGLLLCAGIALLVGWLLAGRLLAPIDRITRAAENIAAGNLHRRVALAGPRDELKRLADTFDGMLARLERTFDAQGRFAANASHELLTPLATARTILETTSPGPLTAVEVAALSTKLLTLNERSEHIIEALLTLAKADQAPVQRDPVDLALLVASAVDRIRAEAAGKDVTIETDLHVALAGGNPVLYDNLVDNLLANAVRYNRPGGTVRIFVARSDQKTEITVSNTGPLVPADLMDQLFEPFVRAEGRTYRGDGSGHGLGMAIVQAVAHAHAGTVEARANPTGGLTVTVLLPALIGADRAGVSQ